MKRSGFGPRTTGLARKTELDSRSELTRSPTPRTGPPTPQQQRRAAQVREWIDLRLQALDRDEDQCVGCGQTGAPLEVHHRAGKGAGGSRELDVIHNLVTLCGSGNVTGCHAWAHKYKNTHAAARGLSVPRGSDYATWPVEWHDGTKWLLLPDGGREQVA